MPWPIPSFGSLSAGPQLLADFDLNFNAVGAASIIACTASGSNTIILTSKTNYFTPAAYSDGGPFYTWVQAVTNTAPTTINANSLGALTAYKNNGQTAIGAGDLQAGFTYVARTEQALNSGAGGFVVDVFGGGGGGGVGTLVSINIYNGSQTITIPATATKAWVMMAASTGGTGGSSVTSTATAGSGAGGYAESYLTGLTAGNTIVYTQGAAGTAGGVGTSGGNAGNSTLASGTQSISTITCNGSNGTNGSAGVDGSPSAGGSATGGNILNLTGQKGGQVDSTPTGFVTGGCGGRNYFSTGVDGVINAAGNAGASGALIIAWFT